MGRRALGAKRRRREVNGVGRGRVSVWRAVCRLGRAGWEAVEAAGRRPGLGHWLGLISSLLWVCMGGSAWGAAQEELVALLVASGKGTVDGHVELKPLPTVEADLVRMLEVLPESTRRQGALVLAALKEPARERVAQLGVARVGEPTTSALTVQLKKAKELVQARRQASPGARVRFLFYISSHGRDNAFRMDDGWFSKAELASQLQGLGADSVLVVADACYSSQFLMKASDGVTPVFKEEELARVLEGSHNVGGVYAQRETIQHPRLGGILTFAVTTGLRGAADRDGNGLITFEELQEHLRMFTRVQRFPIRLEVRSPSRAGRNAPAFVRSRGEPGGLYFPPTGSHFLEEYFVYNAAQQPVAIFEKLPGEDREISLPPGEYSVRCFSPPAEVEGREGEFTVGGEMVVVRQTRLAQVIQFKGVDIEPRASLLSAVPTRGFRLGGSVPGSGLREGVGSDPLTQEEPFWALQWTLDWDIQRTSWRGMSLGMLLGGGVSVGNRVLGDGDVALYRLEAGFRMGYDREVGVMGYRLGGYVGSGVAGPLERSASLQPYQLRLVPMAGLELGIGRSWGSNRSVSLSFEPGLHLEQYALSGFQVYPSWQVLVGTRWW